LKDQSEWTESTKSIKESLSLISRHFSKYATLETRRLLEASARGLTFAMADVISGALLCQHAAWSAAKAKANPSNSIIASEATIDRVSAQRWCESLDKKLSFQIEALVNESRYEEDKLMLFGLADARTSCTTTIQATIASKL
jgi:hypothetical protein